MRGKEMMHNNPAVEAALKANDYNAFLTAWNADTKKPANATAPTQAQFTEMATRYQKMLQEKQLLKITTITHT